MHRPEMSADNVVHLLREHGITPTSQRVDIARALFSRREHLSAEDVFLAVNSESSRVSKATVYNTLGLFAAHGLVREVIADPDRTFYDPNTLPHHHFYDTATGALIDIPAEAVEISRLPVLPDGVQMEGVDVIVRVRSGAR